MHVLRNRWSTCTVGSPTAALSLEVGGPADDPTTPEDEGIAAGDVKVYGSNGSDMVSMSLTLDASGKLTGTWDVTLAANAYTPVTWYATVAEGAPIGYYTFGADLDGGVTLAAPFAVKVAAPETHGEVPPDTGEDTTPPVVSITPVGVPGATATFAFSADDVGTTFDRMLAKDGTPLETWASCTSPKAYTDLDAGSYVFSVRGTRGELVSQIATWAWVVGPPPDPDTTPPVVTVVPLEPLGTTASFTFTANEPVTKFQCQLTKNGKAGEWLDCESPKTYEALMPARYSFSSRAVDLAGNVSTGTAPISWSVSKASGR